MTKHLFTSGFCAYKLNKSSTEYIVDLHKNPMINGISIMKFIYNVSNIRYFSIQRGIDNFSNAGTRG
jgi:hypothetical protein